MLVLNTQLTKQLALLLLPLLAFTGLNVSADSHEAPPAPPVLETFFCNYNPGKDRDDLDAATNFYLKQAEKAGITPTNAFLWTHTNGAAPWDMLWLNVHDNLVAFGEADDAGAAAPEMEAVGARYDSVATCTNGLATVTAVLPPPEGSNATPDGGTLVTYACRFQPGRGPDALPDLGSHIAEVNKGLGDAGLNAVFQIIPMNGNPQMPDVVLVAGAGSTTAWANNIAALNTTPAGQSLLRHFNAVVDCDMNLWRSEEVVFGDG
jgi:hypothetical protein